MSITTVDSALSWDENVLPSARCPVGDATLSWVQARWGASGPSSGKGVPQARGTEWRLMAQFAAVGPLRSAIACLRLRRFVDTRRSAGYAL